MFFFWLVVCFLFIPQRLFVPVKVIGRKKLLRKQAVIIAGNHQSSLDPILIPMSLGFEPVVMAKHTLFKGKFGSWFFRHLGCIPVNRGDVGLSTVKSVLGALKQNKPVLIFPEGTRKEVMDEGSALKGGVAMFSLKADCYIQPMFFLKKPRAFRINKLIIGDPFKLTEFEGQKITSELLDSASKIVGEKILELKTNYYAEKEQKKLDKKQEAREKEQEKQKTAN